MKYLHTQHIDLDRMERNELENTIRIMADDLLSVVVHHASNSKMSDRDIDDIRGMLADLSNN